MELKRKSMAEKGKIFSPPKDQNPAIHLVAGHTVSPHSLAFTCRCAAEDSSYYYYSHSSHPIQRHDSPLVGHGLLIIEASRRQTHHNWKDSSGRVISPIQRPLPENTQHSQDTDVCVLSGSRRNFIRSSGAVSLHISALHSTNV